MITTFDVPEYVCTCGVKLGACGFVGAEEERPRPGDVSVCVKCGAVLVFLEGLHLRPMTPEELAELDADECYEILSIRCAIVELHREDSEAARIKLTEDN